MLKRQVRDTIRFGFRDPFRQAEVENTEQVDALMELDPEKARMAASATEVRQDSRGGRDFANFLATDKVPDTLFGIPVVSTEDQYQGKDIAFFRGHPEAGGYYDMGEDMV